MDKLQEYYKHALMGGEIAPPLCDEFKHAWMKCHDDKNELVKLALRQQSIPHLATFAYKGHGITKDYVKKNFKDFINGRVMHDCDLVNGYTYQLWVDAPKSQEIALNVDVSNFMWCVGNDIIIPQCKCPVIYVNNASDVNLVLDGHNTVTIYLFDESQVTIADADETCKVLVYNYSREAFINKGNYCLCDVRVFEKNLRL